MKDFVDSCATRSETIARTFIGSFGQVADQIEDGQLVLQDAQAVADTAARIRRARSPEEALMLVNQNKDAFVRLHARITQPGAQSWAHLSRPLLEIGDYGNQMLLRLMPSQVPNGPAQITSRTTKDEVDDRARQVQSLMERFAASFGQISTQVPDQGSRILSAGAEAF